MGKMQIIMLQCFAEFTAIYLLSLSACGGKLAKDFYLRVLLASRGEPAFSPGWAAWKFCEKKLMPYFPFCIFSIGLYPLIPSAEGGLLAWL
ncbi:hypothetical protein [Sedimentisphaera salicampi]|uniref:hypothetical protein n=1 Tax=Sedimentisphaera salicampi TaxID=1941349 RepID=UPI000F4E2A4F|nr:hypothetical protein [Sedimentisphaera salicampi]